MNNDLNLCKHLETFDRDEFRRKMRYYSPCERFMEGGALYGRSRHTPLVGGRVQRIFRTCIHIKLSDLVWFRTSNNTRAYNAQELYPLFAYQFRPQPWYPTPPRSLKSVPEPIVEWGEAA